MSDQINNQNEKSFNEKMEAAGHRLIYQPYIKELKMRPDFLDLKTNIYFEVIASRQAYHNRKDKFELAKKLGIQLKLVKPDGSPYVPSSMKLKIKNLECKRCGYSWVPRKEEVRYCPKCKTAWFDTPKDRPEKDSSITRKTASI